jgi:hypothetical protein
LPPRALKRWHVKTFVDQVLAAAGIPIMRVRWQRRYDAGALTQQIAGYLEIAMPAPITAPLLEPALENKSSSTGAHVVDETRVIMARSKEVHRDDCH